ncbi:unnamed protein product [Gordionus sp. m RMFG-2023]|uniref:glucose-6-phosphate exchanger SLC37A1-like n=1 Tax=Gordionus sp. m RMFG-2023 TaxID=3053472 RepID=UPI0030DF53E9
MILRLCIFLILWSSYLLLYFTRKPLGIIKVNLEKDYDYSKFQIGLLDSAFLLPYSLGQIFFVNTIKQHNPMRFLLVTLILAGLSTLSLGLVVGNFGAFFILLALNGSFQAFFWPLAIQLISNIFTHSSHLNLILGIYGTCAFSGGTIGTLFAVYIRDKYDWRLIYPITSLIMICCAIVFMIIYEYLKTRLISHNIFQGSDAGNIKTTNGVPKAINALRNIYQNPMMSISNIYQALINKIHEALAIFKTVPMVFDVSLFMLCLKTIRYILYMWLPLLLEQKSQYNSTKAGNISAIFEIGGLLGSIILGYLLDRYFKRCQMKGVYYFLVCNLICIFVFLYCTSDPGINWITTASILLFLGLFLGGLDNMMGSCVPLFIINDYHSHHPAKKLSNEGKDLSEIVDESEVVVDKSTVIGLVNGVGSLGTFIEGPFIGFLLVSNGMSSSAFTRKDLSSANMDIDNWFRFYVLIFLLALIPVIRSLVSPTCRKRIFAKPSLQSLDSKGVENLLILNE